MEPTLITVKQLHDRWDMSETHIRDLVREKKLPIIKTLLPGIFFSVTNIEKIENEGMDIDTEFTPFERRKLQQRITDLEHQNSNYENILRNWILQANQAAIEVNK